VNAGVLGERHVHDPPKGADRNLHDLVEPPVRVEQIVPGGSCGLQPVEVEEVAQAD
jgi:hypothetical protein